MKIKVELEDWEWQVLYRVLKNFEDLRKIRKSIRKQVREQKVKQE